MLPPHRSICLLHAQELPVVPSSSQGSRIVGFEVEPSSIKHVYTGAWKGVDTSLTTCGGSPGAAAPLAMDSSSEAIFTYDVKWEFSEIKWASRWDTYLLMGDEQIHWYVPKS